MIDSSSNVLDSRDIIERLEALRDEREAIDSDDTQALTDWDISSGEELAALLTLDKEGREYASDWKHGETLINADYWVEYVKELLADCGDLPKTIPSYIVINWDATAENIKADYTEIDFGGETFYIRCS